MNENQLIAERIGDLDPAYATLIKSDFISTVSTQLAQVAGLNQDQTNILNNGITLYLLFFINLDELTNFIARECGISPDQAFEISYAFTLCLPKGYTDTHTVIFNKITTEENTGLDSEIAETENLIENIEHINTMEKNVLNNQNTDFIYKTSQDNLLRR